MKKTHLGITIGKFNKTKASKQVYPRLKWHPFFVFHKKRYNGKREIASNNILNLIVTFARYQST